LFDVLVLAGETPRDFFFFIFGREIAVLNKCLANVLPLHQERLVEDDLEGATCMLQRF
jgi:hypothetical protein